MAETPRNEPFALVAIRDLLKYIGEDPDRPGLADTPARVLKAWRQDWGRGYRGPEVASLLTMFEPDSAGHIGEYGPAMHPEFDQMVIVKDLVMYSTCEHHMAPFFGSAHIAYIPSVRGIVGLSKLARVLEHFARRLQVQERLTCQIADALAEHLSPHVGVVIEATHMCMVSRGVQQPKATTRTTALRGVLRDADAARAEFLSAIRG